MSEHEMLEEHARELADIKAGVARRPVDPAAVQRRSRRYLPLAGMLAAALLFGIYQFITFEETAIATIDRDLPEEAFDPLTPTPFPTALPSATPLALAPVWDDNLERVFADRCVQCHGGAAGLDFSTYNLALQGGRNGPVIIPGDPGGSPIVIKMGQPHPGRFTDFELQVLRDWITAGAPQG
jgi:hypothetical protein